MAVAVETAPDAAVYLQDTNPYLERLGVSAEVDAALGQLCTTVSVPDIARLWTDSRIEGLRKSAIQAEEMRGAWLASYARMDALLPRGDTWFDRSLGAGLVRSEPIVCQVAQEEGCANARVFLKRHTGDRDGRIDVQWDIEGNDGRSLRPRIFGIDSGGGIYASNENDIDVTVSEQRRMTEHLAQVLDLIAAEQATNRVKNMPSYQEKPYISAARLLLAGRRVLRGLLPAPGQGRSNTEIPIPRPRLVASVGRMMQRLV